MGTASRPDREDLTHWAGYVRNLRVEQTGERDAVVFDLVWYLIGSVGAAGNGYVEDWGVGSIGTVDHSVVPLVTQVREGFVIWLDVGTTVAVTQFQLLRDALQNTWLIQIYFDPAGGDGEYFGESIVYEVRVLPHYPYPTSVQDAPELYY